MHLHSSVRALISLFETPEKLHRSFPLYDGVIIPNLVTQAKRCGRLSHTNQRTCTGFHIIYTPWVKKGDTPLLLSISLLNIDRFSQFFHRRTQLLHYLVKCWKRNRKTSNNLNQVSCLTINQQIFNELHEPYPRQLMQSVTTNTQKLMSSSSPKAGTQASAPLVDGIINHSVAVRPRPQPVAQSTRSRPLLFLDWRDLASLHKSCNLLGWDLSYSEATDQVRWMQVSPVAAVWLSRVPCAPVHCLVGYISQGSVATHLRWGGLFINNFIAQFQLSTSVKELWKSVNI